MAHSAWREAQIRSGRGARRRILFYETENIIPGAFRTGARHKWFYEIDPRVWVLTFFLNFASIFLLFPLLGVKNIEKAYFDPSLECPAPKSWSKYTTHVEIK